MFLRIIAIGVVSVLSCLSTGQLAAQPLVERVPADAIFYVGWKGADSMGADYAGSNLQQVLAGSQFGALFTEMIPGAIQRFGQEDAQTAAIAKVAYGILADLWRYPTALYFQGLDAATGMPQLGLLVQAGDDANTVAQTLSQYLPPNGAPIQIKVEGGLLIVSPDPDALVQADLAKLSGNATFKQSMAKVGADPAVAMYVDFDGLFLLADQLVESPMVKQQAAMALQGRDPAELLGKLRAALGVDGIESLAFAAQFVEGDWETRGYLAADQANADGLLFTTGTDATGGELIQVIPSSAAMAGVYSFDLKSFYDKLRNGIADFDAQLGQQVNMGLAMVEGMLGQSIGEDVLANLGPQWAYYTDRGVGGTGWAGMVVMNDLNDPEAAGKAFKRLGAVATGMAGQGLAMSPQPIKLGMRELFYENEVIHYLATPAVAPSWAIVEGRLYVGLQPQTVAAAIDYSKSNRPSLKDNPVFKQRMAQLAGDHTASGFSWVDTEQKLNDSYQTTTMLARYVTGFADMFGVEAPALIIPPLSRIQPHLSPALSASWSDEGGHYFGSRSAFPMSLMVSTEQYATVVPVSLMAGILLPSLGRAREVANRTVCAANMVGIHKAMYTWAVQNKKRYPRHLSELLVEGSMSPKSLACPSAGSVNEPLPQQKAEWEGWVDRHSHYIYLGAGKKTSFAADRVLMYEKLDNHSQGEGINILFGDGHVKFHVMAEAMAILSESGITP